MASTKTTSWSPTEVSPPGETLSDLLEDRSMSQADLATRMGRPKKTVNEIIKGKAQITPETALQLEAVLGVPATFWNTREQKYREYLARTALAERLETEQAWLKSVPHKELAKRGWIPTPSTNAPGEIVRNVLHFFGVSSPEAWETTYAEPVVQFRLSTSFEPNKGAVAAWLRRGEIEARKIQCAAYDESTFRSTLKEIRCLTREEPEVFQERVVALCSQAGVAVTFVPELKGSVASGATRWLSHTKAAIQLSLRYKADDHLWFSFFHEAGHILLHGKRQVFIESGKRGSEAEEEKQADKFAQDLLIPPAEYRRLLNMGRPISKAMVQDFSAEIGVAPGVVVGRLQHEKVIPFTHLNALKRRLCWSS